LEIVDFISFTNLLAHSMGAASSSTPSPSPAEVERLRKAEATMKTLEVAKAKLAQPGS